ncbi:MAG: tetratricopeptide repeat protein [Candidatus Binataceae bacterium]
MQQREYALEEAAARANREVYSKNKFLAKADARADRIIAYRRAGVEPWFAGTLEAAAVDEIRAAAESGDPKQQERLGLMYLFGLGVPQSEADAATWTRRAAAKGYTVAETNLGAMYGNGWGVPQDTDRAIKWYKEAAAHGDLDAKKSLRSLVGARPDQDRLRGHRP